jgi:hypothetical protein
VRPEGRGNNRNMVHKTTLLAVQTAKTTRLTTAVSVLSAGANQSDGRNLLEYGERITLLGWCCVKGTIIIGVQPNNATNGT